jgi:hypothetical protein
VYGIAWLSTKAFPEVARFLMINPEPAATLLVFELASEARLIQLDPSW